MTEKARYFTEPEIENILTVKKVLSDTMPFSTDWVIAGSCISEMLRGLHNGLNIDPGIDVFTLSDKFEGLKFVDHYDVEKLIDPLIEYTNGNINNVTNYNQAHVRWFGTSIRRREQFLKHIDFLHCTPTFYFDEEVWDFKLSISPAAYEAIVSKMLIRNPKSYKAPQKLRIEKFVGRGYSGELAPKLQPDIFDIEVEPQKFANTTIQNGGAGFIDPFTFTIKGGGGGGAGSMSGPGNGTIVPGGGMATPGYFDAGGGFDHQVRPLKTDY